MFVKEVCNYFMNFLETDFKRRRIPKRVFVLKDRNSNLTGTRLNKYPSFRRKLIDLINSEESNHKVSIRRGTYTSNIQATSTDVITKLALSQLENLDDSLNQDLESKVQNLFLQHHDDHEIFVQESIASITEALNENIVKESVKSLTGTLQRESESEDEDTNELGESLSRFIVDEYHARLSESLVDFQVKKEIKPLLDIWQEILDPEVIKSSFSGFFETFAIRDLHSEIAELLRNKKLKEGLEIYLNLGELKFRNHSFPVFFLPLLVTEITHDGKLNYELSFEKRYIINKKAIEYTFQEATGGAAATISSTIGDRITYVEDDSTLCEALNDKMAGLLSQFNTDNNVDFSKDYLTTSKNSSLQLNNELCFSLFDKADESAINDYEELIDYLDENNEVGKTFAELIASFIEEEPKMIVKEVSKEWDSTGSSDRLVFSSPIPLNEEQRKIVSAINNPESRFITVQGPPGTGKSHTITAILFEAILKNKSVLMLSDKKEALDVVEDKLEQTLNQVRIDEGENFQNPILRLGREGNTYSKILQSQNIENIRNYARSTEEELKQADTEEVEKNLKDDVDTYIDKYKDVEIKEIKEYLTLKAKLGLGEEDEETLSKHLSFLTKLATELSILQSVMLNEELTKIISDNEAETVNEISQLVSSLEIAHKYKENYENLLKSLQRFEYIESYLKEKLSFYEEIKSRLLSFLLGNFQLKDWNNSLNSDLSFKEVFDFRRSANLNLLKDYYRLNQEISKDLTKTKSVNADKDLISTYILEDKLMIDKKELKDFVSSLKKLKRDLEEEEILEELNITINSETSLSDDISDSIERVKDLANLAEILNSLKGKFEEIPNLNFSDSLKNVQLNSTVKMVNIFDKRFIDFVDENRTTARTLKQLIVKKKKFPRAEIEHLRNAFPCIIAGIRDYADYVPLEPELFDLIVIDEASQVSIAQAFPAILRAKKIVVMGDKKQFSNVKATNSSKLINAGYQDGIRKAFRETFGDDIQKEERSKLFNIKVSILEFFEYLTNYDGLLKKHFRGYPEIISFSSKYFYDNLLQTIKVRAKPIEEVITFEELEHDGKSFEKVGKVSSKNINSIESNFIVSRLEELSELSDPPSVGVITPMRDQQRFIFSEIEKSPKYNQIEKLNVKVMTFDSCQGEERDVIFYSFVDSPNNDVSQYVLGKNFDLNNIDAEENLRLQRLNVGMSRAKEQVVFVTSKPINDYGGNAFKILSHYRDEIEKAKKLPSAEDVDPNSPMELKVLEWIKQTTFFADNHNNIELTAQFEVGKYLKELDPGYKHPDYRCDFLMTLKSKEKTQHLIIEYDGFLEHFVDRDIVNEFNYSHYYNEKDIEREKILEGYGFPFLRLNRFNLGKDPVKNISNQLASFFLSKKSLT